MLNPLIANSRAKLTTGQKATDFFTHILRSWRFVISQFAFVALWIICNVRFNFDPTFSILKLILIVETSFVGSILLMAQNRQSTVDRKIAIQDYAINWGSKKELDKILSLIKEDNTATQEALTLLKKNETPIDKSNG